MENIRDRLIDTAEALIQHHGYNGFSYRDIADEVGIRSASIHYHFPAKVDLGVAVASRYRERFMERLRQTEILTTDVTELLETYVGLFRETFGRDRRMCLCGMLAAEIEALPEAVATEAQIFFEANLNWLTRLTPAKNPEGKARKARARRAISGTFLASLEGAMIVSKAMNEPNLFDQIAANAVACMTQHT